LDANIYINVSRRHAVICQKNDRWEITDLGSANGTYINGKLLQGSRVLGVGDRIMLGRNGPVFTLEVDDNTPIPETAEPLTFTQLFPIASTGKHLTEKAYLVPAVLTVFSVVLMFAFVGNPVAFNLIIAIYLAAAAYYYIYQLCGKYKPWWVLFCSGLATIIILISPILYIFLIVFRGILPGSIPQPGESIRFIPLFITMFFGAGLMEELLKSLPLFGAIFISKKLKSPWRGRIGISEPLDGILLGTSSAVGFTLLETLGQYVPDVVHNATLQAGEGTGQLLGLQLLIPRILGSVSGHMAYSGYLGYFIGLSVLKPRKRWRILITGYLTASGLHALWNSTGYYSVVLLAIVGIISYAFLAAAILKARALSPTRSENFATNISSEK
jgi:RsiW-degrading membrane proteinase PrsW (M82 family)